MADYTRAKTAVNYGTFIPEVNAAISPAVLVDGVYCDGVNVYLHTDVTLSAGQETAMNTAIDNHEVETLGELITKLSAMAYTYYQGCMAAGFTHNTKTFPLTSAAIADWSSLNQSKGSITYPILIPSGDGTQYSITDSAEVTTMFDAAVLMGKTCVADYSTALDNIVTATTKTAAQTAYDNYVGA